MLKKVIMTLGLSLAISASAFAAVTEKVEQGDRYKLSYPVFKLESRSAARAINKDIKAMVKGVKKLTKSEEPKYVEVGTNYKIVQDTDSYVNLSFVTWDYMGGAHGMHFDHGIVYDKATGERLPYTHFTDAVEAEQLKQGIADGTFKVFCADLQTASEAPFLKYIKDFQVSENYIIGDDGHVYLMYQPYELDSYAAGVTYVQLP